MSKTAVATHKKAQVQSSKKPIAFPVRLFAEGDDSAVSIPEQVHIIPTGEWDHPMYGEMKITEDDIAEFAQNFRAGVRKEIPITAGHEVMEELPAVGWIKDVLDRGKEGLFALVEWTEEGKRLLKERSFKYFSPEYYPVYDDPTSGRTYRNVLIGGALTNKPFFKELEGVTAFSEPTIINQFNEISMDIETIVAKSPEELSDEEKQFLQENESELNDEQREQFASVLDESDDGAGDGDDDEGDAGEGDADADGDGEGDDEGEGDGEPQEHGEKKKAGGGMKDKRKKRKQDEGAGDGKVVLSEAQYRALEDKANAGYQAHAELEKRTIREEVGKMVFSEGNKEAGRILPKQKDAVEKFMLTLSEKQRDQFKNIVNNLPKPELFGERGSSEDTKPSAQKELDKKIEEKMKASEGTLKYGEALKQVFKEDPQLENRYYAEMQGTQA